jgi:hypothetical protein
VDPHHDHGLERRLVALLPDHGAGVEIECGRHLAVAGAGEGVNLAGGDDRAGVAGAHFDRPHLVQLGRPGAGDLKARGGSIPRRASPLRPFTAHASAGIGTEGSRVGRAGHHGGSGGYQGQDLLGGQSSHWLLGALGRLECRGRDDRCRDVAVVCHSPRASRGRSIPFEINRRFPWLSPLLHTNFSRAAR